MRKIPTLYKRDPNDRRYVTDEVTPGCEWVLDGEGVATRKVDGTCVMRDSGGRWWARREVKPDKPAPAGFVEVQRDETTGKTVGWEPVEQSPFVKFWREAVDGRQFAPGTHELLGPKINGNPEDVEQHVLIPHDPDYLYSASLNRASTPRDAVEMARERGWEGVVWHHRDGRMAKLKVRDYPAEES